MDSGLLDRLNTQQLAELTSEAISGNLTLSAHELDAADDHDYESLPSSAGTQVHLLAGAAAGIMEHCVMYPIDSVKVRFPEWLTTSAWPG